MNRRLERVNVASLRVALISTGIVAVVYAIVAVVVVVLVTNNLTSQIDARLAPSLAYYQQHLPRIATRRQVGQTAQGGLASPTLFWFLFPPGVLPSGNQISSRGRDDTAG